MNRSIEPSNSTVKKSRSSESETYPPHHFNLGGKNFVVVTDSSDTLRVHLRKYLKNESDHFVPTKMGVTLSPIEWQTLANDFESLRPTREKPEIVQDTLMLSVIDKEDTEHTVIQRYIQQKDFVRMFLSPICILSESEWKKLKDIRTEVTKDITSMLYGRLFPKIILKEVDKHTCSNTTTLEKSVAEMVLTTSMIELLKCHLSTKIDELFVCSGCEENYENQLGHECVTFNYGQRLSQCGHLAFFSLDLELLASEFVEENLHLIHFITEEFMTDLDMDSMVRHVKEFYVASDPIPLRMF